MIRRPSGQGIEKLYEPDEKPHGSARRTHKWHRKLLPRTSLEGALGKRGRKKRRIRAMAKKGQPYTSGAWLVERSEEHTSELQSRQYLVCRLLLEKKKIQ